MLDGVKKLAIHGKAKTGKNTVAKLIHEICDYDVYETAFAFPVKNELINLFGIHQDYLFGPSQERQEFYDPIKEITYRDLLIEFGQYCKKYDPDIWIKKTEKNILKSYFSPALKEVPFKIKDMCEINTCYRSKEYKLILITDLRFMREFEWLKKEGFKLLKLTRSNNDYFNNDVSEIDLDNLTDFDFQIENDSSIEDLNEKVKLLLSKL
jgi:hypothetical protein